MAKNIDLMTELELDKCTVVAKCSNDFDGNYYRLKNEFKKDKIINYYDFLDFSNGVTIEFLFRLNVYRNHTCIELLNIKNDEGNFIIEILVFDDDYYFLKVIHKHTEKMPEDEYEIYESDRLCKSLISDGKWHKLTFCITSQVYKVWLNYDLILDKLNPSYDNRNNLQFFKTNIEQQYSIGKCDKELLGLDLKQIKLTNRLKEIDCEILTELNSDVRSKIDLKKKLNQKLKPYEKENDSYFKINESISGDLRVPEIITKPNQITNITFECTLRHRGPIKGQMILLLLKDNFEQNSQIFAINSGRILCWIENFHYFKCFNHARGKLEGINIYDGDWHTIKIQIIPELKEEEYDDPIAQKRIKFWADEKLYGEDTVPGSLLFHSVLQQFVMFENNFGIGYKDFEVKMIQFHVNQL